jgi:hypothetical protein
MLWTLRPLKKKDGYKSQDIFLKKKRKKEIKKMKHHTNRAILRTMILETIRSSLAGISL